MERQSDSVRFQEALDRHITGNWGEDSVASSWEDSAQNERVGELVQSLLEWGDLLIFNREDSFSVSWWDDSTRVDVELPSLLDALERVQWNVEKVMNYS